MKNDCVISSHLNFLIWNYDSIFCRKLAIDENNFLIFAVLVLQKSIPNNKLRHIQYLSPFRNDSSLKIRKPYCKYSPTSTISEIWNFVIFSLIFINKDDVIENSPTLAHYYLNSFWKHLNWVRYLRNFK